MALILHKVEDYYWKPATPGRKAWRKRNVRVGFRTRGGTVV